MTLNEIRQQLKTIRLYYANKARFSTAFDALPHTVKELADKYAAIVSCALLDLYYIYYELYVRQGSHAGGYGGSSQLQHGVHSAEEQTAVAVPATKNQRSRG